MIPVRHLVILLLIVAVFWFIVAVTFFGTSVMSELGHRAVQEGVIR